MRYRRPSRSRRVAKWVGLGDAWKLLQLVGGMVGILGLVFGLFAFLSGYPSNRSDALVTVAIVILTGAGIMAIGKLGAWDRTRIRRPSRFRRVAKWVGLGLCVVIVGGAA